MRRLLCLAALPIVIAADLPERVVPRPLGNPGDWVTPQDYPPGALREMRVGTSGFRLEVDENGDVTGCSIIAPSGTPELDDTTCALLRQRALFSPPRDKAGQPVRAYYRSRVRWTLPKSVAFSPAETLLEFDMDEAGIVTNCRSVNQRTFALAPPFDCEKLAADVRTKAPPKRPIHVRIHTIVEVTDLEPAK